MTPINSNEPLPAPLYLLSCQEQQDVSLHFLTHVYLEHCPDRGFQVIPLWLRCVEDLHGMSATRHAHKGSIVKVVLKKNNCITTQRAECFVLHRQLGSGTSELMTRFWSIALIYICSKVLNQSFLFL